MTTQAHARLSDELHSASAWLQATNRALDEIEDARDRLSEDDLAALHRQVRRCEIIAARHFVRARRLALGRTLARVG